jgi:subtilisin family serine protease
MSENNTPTNEDASNPDSSSTSDPPDVLDTSGEGGPYIPSSATPGASDPSDVGGGAGGPHTGGGGPQPAPPATEEFIVEVELAPGVDNIDELLSSITGLESTAGADAPQESDFARAARAHGLIEAQPVFTREEVERHRARIDAARESSLESVAAGGSPEGSSESDPLSRLTSYITLRFPAGTSVAEVLAELRALPQVKSAAVVPQAAPPSLPNDPFIGVGELPVDVAAGLIQRQWYLHRTRVPQAWELGRAAGVGRGAGVVIADVDFGCRVTHREFVGAIEHTHNSYDGTDQVICGDEVGHGTGVLGIAGARSDGKGLAGYAPDATLWAIQGDFGCKPRITETPWKDAINHVLDTDSGGRRKVILIELETKPLAGNYEQVSSIRDMIRLAILQNCVVVVTAGNGDRPANENDNNQPFEPTGSILVGGTLADGEKNKRAPYSNYGPEVVVSAPGDKLHDVTCSPKSDTAYRNDFGGTSGAAAKVAGTVALMLSVNPKLTHAEVREILGTTGSQIITDDPDKRIGVFLNAEAAVLEARNRLNN